MVIINNNPFTKWTKPGNATQTKWTICDEKKSQTVEQIKLNLLLF